MRRRQRVLPMVVVSVATVLWTAVASAKLISLDDRCACAGPWRSHSRYVRCVKQNAYRYLRFEARLEQGWGGATPTRAELRAAARVRVAEAVRSRCGYEQYRCEVGSQPCPTGETCDVRGCERTRGVCVPTPESCAANVDLRCTCSTATEPYGRAYSNDCERLRAGAALDAFANPPYTRCQPSCGGREGLTCPEPLTCLYPDGTCGAFGEHGRCVERSADRVCPPAPVCGCDDTTYSTRCEADDAGVHVAYAGACGARCGGPPHLACAPDLYCFKDWNICDQVNAWGVCRRALCLEMGTVCGCDGEQYARPCDAIFAGTQVRGYPVNGECPTP